MRLLKASFPISGQKQSDWPSPGASTHPGYICKWADLVSEIILYGLVGAIVGFIVGFVIALRLVRTISAA